jgi:hypothetical protein
MAKTTSYFIDWFNNSVIYKNELSRDAFGKIIYASDGETLPCYISGQTRMVTNDKGEEVVSFEQIYLLGSNATVASIDHTGIMEIDEKDKPIKAVEKFYDELGDLDLVVVYL